MKRRAVMLLCMASRPLIGLSCSQFFTTFYRNGVAKHYTEALEQVGALPMLLPVLPELAADYARQVDAVLLTGGVDVHPRHFGEHPRRGLGAVDEQRDAFEEALYRAARELGKPVFGICRGLQMINVLEGGTLWQHLPDAPDSWIDHSQQADPPVLGHEVAFSAGSLLERHHGARALVNSYHHQAIRELAPTLRATAVAPDGIVEGIEGDGLLAVQWHPELLFAAHPHTLGTFKAFMSLLK